MKTLQHSSRWPVKQGSLANFLSPAQGGLACSRPASRFLTVKDQPCCCSRGLPTESFAPYLLMQADRTRSRRLSQVLERRCAERTLPRTAYTGSSQNAPGC
jgi:hypothetical protein